MDKRYNFEPEKYKTELIGITQELRKLPEAKRKDEKYVAKILKKFPKDSNKLFSKDHLISGLDYISKNKLIEDLTDQEALEIKNDIKMKPMRTESGVTTVTVLTKPGPCPGKCIFCPNDVRMPKSYIATEPGAQRALANRFSPYLQVWNRLQAIKNIGHPTQKIELLVLGGTWSSYKEEYQVWFIYEMFRALNDFGEGIKNTGDNHESVREYLKTDFNDEIRGIEGNLSYNKLLKTKTFEEKFNDFIAPEEKASWEELEEIHAKNATAKTRCVGLVLETRSDFINKREAFRLRRLGATKIQLGVQTLDDEVSRLNKRGENRKQVENAFRLLRDAGFKIHVHMMPNLHGATPTGDKEVYRQLFEEKYFKPDEVKIYPTSTIKFTELHELEQSGEYVPYSTEQLIDLIADMMEITPEYCRLTRIIRDIPSTEIEAGNKTTNLREFVEWKLERENRANPNIRAREVKDLKVSGDDLHLESIQYDTEKTTELFLQYITRERKIAGFLRLSLPKEDTNDVTNELDSSAMIREVHVYGPALRLKRESSGEAQHLGLGSALIEEAKKISKEHGFKKLAVISAIGTREYYRKRGFDLVDMYQVADF